MKKFLLYIFLIVGLLSANPCYAIKIGLQVNASWVGVGSSGATSLIDANTSKIGAVIDITIYLFNTTFTCI